MKLSIDRLTELTGWTVNAPTVLKLNDHPRYISGLNNTASLAVQFSRSDTVRTLSKTYTSIDVSDYEFLVFQIWSLSKGKNEYNRNVASDFSYKIQINDTAEYFLPVYDTFTDVNINIEDIATIDRIVITALHNDDDSIIISDAYVEYEEMPIDLMESVKEHLAYHLEQQVGSGIVLGTYSGTAGLTLLEIGDFNYLDRYATIQISDGTNSEIHQICEKNDHTGLISLLDTYDGNSLKNTYIDATVRLIFPIEINPDQRWVRLPGIVIWGFTPESILRTGKIDVFKEAFKTDGTTIERIEGHVWAYPIQIDCEARASGLLAIMSKAVRDFIASEIVWVNGRKHETEPAGAPTETKPVQGIDIIPQIQYTMTVEVIEIISPAETLANTDTINIDVNLEE